MQNPRKVIFVFLAAMSLSLIIAAFVYYWVNDQLPESFNLNTKTPDAAPALPGSLNDETNAGDSSSGGPAQSNVPGESQPVNNSVGNTSDPNAETTGLPDQKDGATSVSPPVTEPQMPGEPPEIQDITPPLEPDVPPEMVPKPKSKPIN